MSFRDTSADDFQQEIVEDRERPSAGGLSLSRGDIVTPLIDVPPPIRHGRFPYYLYDSVHGVGYLEKAQVRMIYGVVSVVHGLFHELFQRIPEFRAEEDNGHPRDLGGLDQSEDAEKLVESAEAAREEDVGLGGESEHGLPGEKIGEIYAVRLVRIGRALAQEIDAYAHGLAAGLERSLVGRLHDAGAAAGDDGITGVADYSLSQLICLPVVLALRRCHGRAEYGD